MQLIKLTEQEFDNYSINHEQGSFYQTSNWAQIKKQTGWESYYFGLEKDKKIVGASMILKKRVLKFFCFFYAPRGFLIDYKNKDILTTFIKKLLEELKKDNPIFIKIDPYVKYVDRDTHGEIKEGHFKNDDIIKNLEQNKFKHLGFTMLMEGLQPRWAMALNLKDKTIEDIYKNMERNTRNIVSSNERNGMTTRFINKEELHLFKKIMDHTSDRRNFIDRPIEYYETMLDSFKDRAKILIAEFDFEYFLNKLKEELIHNQSMLEERKSDLIEKVGKINVKKTEERIEFLTKEVNRIENKIVKIENSIEEYGSKPVMAGTLFINHGKESLALFGGAYDKFKEYFPSYTVYWNMIKYLIENNYEKYNFYGITGIFKDKNHEFYGLYEFKKGFGCEVEEYIGEFDLIISKSKFMIYKFMLYTYNLLKKVKFKWKSLK